MLRDFIESFRVIDSVLVESMLEGYGIIFESSGGINFESAGGGRYYGYKVMPIEGGNFVSGANKSIRLPIGTGIEHRMVGSGIYLSNSPDYVVDYYSYFDNEDDSYDEGVIQYVFDIDDVIDGKSQLGDMEPEIGVSRAYVNGIIPIREWQSGKRF